MRILAIETSCDETAAAVVSREVNAPLAITERSIVASQIKLHEKYGGVYPEVASREHIRQILPIIAEALGLPTAEPDRLPSLSLKGIDYLAVTHGPGLIGSLLIGVQTVAALGLSTGVPVLQVNHLAGHIYASFIDFGDNEPPAFPLVALIVSGGHTMLVKMTGHHQYQLLGQTRDDAVGEAFDKVAKLLDLPYPGGPQISRLASQGDRFAFNFPVADLGNDTLDFSYSGLKTSVLRAVEKLPKPLTARHRTDIAASFERAAVDALLGRTIAALRTYPARHLILGGGVAANTYLRERLTATLAYQLAPITLHVPPIEICTDNAAVIGAAAVFGNLQPTSPVDLTTHARLPLI